MKNTIIVILVVLLSLSCFAGCADGTVSETAQYTKEQKQEDAAYLWDMVKENFVYQTTDANFALNREEYSRENFIKAIKKTKSDREFYIAVSSFLRELNSPHTNISFMDQYSLFYEPAISNEQYEEKRNYWITHIGEGAYQFPLSVIDRGDEGFIVNDSSIDGISRGDIVLEINNQPAKSFLNDINGGVHMPQKLKFRFVEPLANTKKTVEYQHGDTNVVKPISNNIAANRSFWNLDNDGDVGYLRLATMSLSEMELVDEFLKSISDCEGIIIDVRGNSGGDGAVSEKLIGALYPWDKVSTPMFPCNKFVAINKNGIAEQLVHGSYLFPATLPTQAKHNIPEDMLNVYTTRHIIHKDFLTDTAYKGKVAILQDEKSYSAAMSLVDAVKCGELGVTVGVPALGGDAPFLWRGVLPNSGVAFCISSAMMIASDGSIDEIDGTQPDVFVENTTAEEMGLFLKRNPDKVFWGSEADLQYQAAKQSL